MFLVPPIEINSRDRKVYGRGGGVGFKLAHSKTTPLCVHFQPWLGYRSNLLKGCKRSRFEIHHALIHYRMLLVPPIEIISSDWKVYGGFELKLASHKEVLRKGLSERSDEGSYLFM